MPWVIEMMYDLDGVGAEPVLRLADGAEHVERLAGGSLSVVAGPDSGRRPASSALNSSVRAARSSDA